LSSKTADEPAVLTLVERMRGAIIRLKLRNHSAGAVTKSILKLRGEFGYHFSNTFKTIIVNNGSEFVELSMRVTDGTDE